jgi:hypothetical protein
VLLRAYEGFDVTDASDDSADVHTLDLLASSDDFFGHSLYVCGNLQLHQQSDVLVGTYRSTMVTEFLLWAPMRKDDNLQMRIEDVAAALGRTSAHELGHSLGFVGSGRRAQLLGAGAQFGAGGALRLRSLHHGPGRQDAEPLPAGGSRAERPRDALALRVHVVRPLVPGRHPPAAVTPRGRPR